MLNIFSIFIDYTESEKDIYFLEMVIMYEASEGLEIIINRGIPNNI